MRYFDEPVRLEVNTNVRPALLHLMANHDPGRGDPTALLEVVDAYLRLNPLDEEVLEARERLVGEGRPVGAAAGGAHDPLRDQRPELGLLAGQHLPPDGGEG